MLAREREHTTFATVPRPRHRSNTTLSISRLLASRPPARATIKGPSSARGRSGGREEGGESSAFVYVIPSSSMRCHTLSVRSGLDVSILTCVLCVCRFFYHCIRLSRLAFLYFLPVAFSCALVSRAFPAPAPLAALLIYPLPYRSVIRSYL
jgi:hypothetical protein